MSELILRVEDLRNGGLRARFTRSTREAVKQDESLRVLRTSSRFRDRAKRSWPSADTAESCLAA